jgi:hypothetical protein
MFKSDLIRLKHFQDLYRHSPMLIVYTYAYCVCASFTFPLFNIDCVWCLEYTEFGVCILNPVGKVANSTCLGGKELFRVCFPTRHGRFRHLHPGSLPVIFSRMNLSAPCGYIVQLAGYAWTLYRVKNTGVPK